MMEGVSNNPYVDGYVVLKPIASIPTEWSDHCCEHRLPGVFVVPLNGKTRLTISIGGLIWVPNEQPSATEIMRRLRKLVTQVLDRHRRARSVWSNTSFTIDGLPMAATKSFSHQAA